MQAASDLQRKLFFYLLVCIGSIQPVAAQYYKPFIEGGPTYFITSYYYGSLMGVRFDSAKVNGNDTVFLSYHTFEDTSSQYGYGNCVLYSKGKSWIGFGMTKKSNGDFLFVNKFDDTILIKPNASLNDSWKLIEVTDTTYLEALVEAVQEMNVDDFTDSVKVISLNMKSTDGNSINSSWNGKQLWLSKNHGFLKIVSFYSLPSDTSTLTRFYLPKHTYAWLVNHEVGDEIDYSHQTNNFIGHSATRYIGKEYSPDSTNVTYTILHYSTVQYYFPPSYYDTSYILTDTKTVSHDSSQVCALAGMSYEAIIDTSSGNGFYNLYSFDQCTQTVVSGSGQTYLYCDGDYYSYPFELENYYYFTDYCGIISLMNYFGEAGGETNFTEGLTYYKKGDIECGSSIIIGIQDIPSAHSSLKVFPNPANESFILQLPGSLERPAQLRLTNITGKVLKNEMIKEGNSIYRADISSFPNGVYIIELRDKHMVLTSKLMKE